MKLNKLILSYAAFVLILFISILVTVYSTDTSSAITPGTPRHTHSSVSSGGSFITGATITNSVTPMSVTDAATGTYSLFLNSFSTGSLIQYYSLTTGNQAQIKLYSSTTDTDQNFNLIHASATSSYFSLDTTDGQDDKQLSICPTEVCANNRGASISMYGNENGSPGYNIIRAGDAVGIIQLVTNGATVQQAANGSLTTTKSCAAGYTRRNINYCEKDDHSAAVLPVRDTCTNHTIPAEAKLMHLHMEVFTRSNNAIAARNTSVVIYHDAGCVTGHNAGLSSAYEHTAVAAATLLATDSNEVFFPANGSALYRSKLTDDAGNQGNAEIYELGYYD